LRLTYSLRKKIVIVSVCFLVIGILINTTIHSLIYIDSFKYALVSRAHVMATTVKYKLDRLFQLYIPLQDIEQFDSQCREITSTYDDISYAMVTDIGWNILFHNDAREHGRKFPAQDIPLDFGTEEGPGYIFFTARNFDNVAIPVFNLLGKHEATVIIGFPHALIIDKINQMIWNSLVITLVLTLIMLFFFYMILTTWVTRPFARLLSIIEKIREGGNLTQSENRINTSDEIGQMSEAFYNLLSELKASQIQLEHHTQELEIKVEARTRELNIVNNNLMLHITALEQVKEEEKRLQSQLERSQRLEAVGNLASGVAHDLNNILSGLINYPELLLMEMPPDSPFITPIMNIKRAGERAAAMVQDLLTLARRGVALAIPVNVNSVINDFLSSPEYKSFHNQYEKINVTVKLEKDLANIMGTPFHISKVLMNLFTNSLEAITGEGEITISTQNVYFENPQTGFETIPAGQYVVLWISDSGIGIPQEQVEKIFEPFYTKKVLGRRSGTGLGMSVVYSTVKDHRGFIDVKSVVDGGTSIRLYFRPTMARAEEYKEELPFSDYMGKGELVLVVDDMKEQRDIAETILKRLGYNCRSVDSGENALIYLEKNEADLVVLDMIMDPGIDGLETYKRIIEKWPKQKAIITSGYSETSRIMEIQKLGVNTYLKKPYSVEKLGVAIRTEMERSNKEKS